MSRPQTALRLLHIALALTQKIELRDEWAGEWMRRESPGASAQHKMQKAIRREGLTTPREAVCLGSHPSDPREDGRPGSPRARGQPQAGRGDGGRPQITLRTVFNICKTAIRAAKVNRVPGSSKVSEFKCFPFA